MVDFYNVLGVAHDADGSEIKVAFRKLAKVHHPDLHAGDKRAVQRFQTIK